MMVTLEQYVEDLRYFAKLFTQGRKQAVGYIEFTNVILVDPEDFHARIDAYRKTHDIHSGVFVRNKDNKNEIALCMKTYPALNTMDIMLETGECNESVRMGQYVSTTFAAEAQLDQIFRAFDFTKKQLKKEDK